MAIPTDAIHAIQWSAYHYRRLCREANALATEGRTLASAKRALAAGQLVANLPEIARGLLTNTAECVHVLDVLETLAGKAKELIEFKKYQDICSFLTEPDSNPSDPNHLERLIAAHSAED